MKTNVMKESRVEGRVSRAVAGIAAAVVALWAFAAAPGVINSVSFRFSWQASAARGLTNYVDGTNFAFNFWGTTNLGTPVTNYSKLTCITNWSLGPVNPDGTQWYTSGVFVLPAAQYFAYVTVSNFNGETGPSNVAGNGPVPTDVTSLLLQK